MFIVIDPGRLCQDLTEFLLDPWQQAGKLLPQTKLQRLSELFRPF